MVGPPVSCVTHQVDPSSCNRRITKLPLSYFRFSNTRWYMFSSAALSKSPVSGIARFINRACFRVTFPWRKRSRVAGITGPVVYV